PKSVSPSSPPKCSMMDDLVVGLKKFGREFKPAFSHGAKELVTLSNYKPLTRELVGKENFDALTDNKWTMDDVKAAGGALENLFLGRLKIVKNINKTVKITKRLDKAKQPLQPPKPKQSTGNATKGTGKVKLLPSSKVHDAIGKLNSNQIKHIINGSKKSNHQWEKLVPDKNWGKIKEIIIDVMHNGADIPYKSVSSRVKMVNGQLVQVTYKKLPDGTIRISDAWVK
ncbi:polymorphic toxin type 35 domain-containing protein, partial [Aneurinibacillus thermoaerophilus]|nr:polymorphic toxin type 35 domain-containing protein [Aneurinibacillus thermoaerophilus]